MEVENHEPSNKPVFYDEAFPALPTGGPALKAVAKDLPSFQPATITEVIDIPIEESRDWQLGGDNLFVSEQSKIISKDTGVKIEVLNSNNKSLRVTLSGSRVQVNRAKSKVIQGFQKQATRTIRIPIEYHRFLIGRNRERIHQLEESTLTKIYIPPSAKNSDEITVTGPLNHLDSAEKEIRAVADFHAQQGYERLTIPRNMLPFVRGPNNKVVNEIRERLGVNIGLPPPLSKGDQISVSGPRKEVAQAVQEINKIVKARLERCSTITALISREKHDLVIGPRACGLHDILEQTGVSLEPPTLNSEEFTLRGYPEDLGRALTLVYKRASSSTTADVNAPQRLHRLLIGKKGSALATICDGYKAVRVNFPKTGDRISVEGPEEEVAAVVERLSNRITELQTMFHMESIKVDPKFLPKILGPQGLLMQFIRSNRYSVRIQSQLDDPNIVLEGDHFGVESVKAEIQRIANKMANEKIKDVIVEPRIQKALHVGNPPPIRALQDEFADVEFRFPDIGASVPRKGSQKVSEHNSPTSYIVQLCGVRDHVDAAAEKLSKQIKYLKEENHEQEIRLFKDCIQRILGPTIRHILEETKTRIHYHPASEDGSVVVVIVGRQEGVETAIGRLEKLQRAMSNIVEATIPVPTLLLSKFAESQAALLRSIRAQCEAVYVTLTKTQPRQLIISGPPEAVEKAKALVTSMCSKLMERCADLTIHADPKFHGHLIGRGGANLKRFREKHGVEVLFPDRNVSDPKLATEIHIMGEKEAVATAQKELEQTIQTMENEIDLTIEVENSLLGELRSYRNHFNCPELDSVRIIWPRSNDGGSSPGNTIGRHENGSESATGSATVRLLGAKACVETAQQRLQTMIEDLRSQITLNHPIYDQKHCRTLTRCRPTLNEIQRNYNVIINLNFFQYPKVEHANGSEETLYGHIILTGRPEKIDEVLKNELLPLLPITENFDFPLEFCGKLFIAEQPVGGRQQRQPAGRPPVRNVQNTRNRSVKDAAGTTTTTPGSNLPDTPKNKLMELENKFNVSIQMPPRNHRTSGTIKITGSPEQVEAAKAELNSLRDVYEKEKADWLARSYTETIKIEERFSAAVLNEGVRICEPHGVVVTIRNPQRTAVRNVEAVEVVRVSEPPINNSDHDNASEENPAGENGEESDLTADSEQRTSTIKLNSVFRLLSSAPVSVFLEGYKEKVAIARQEIEAMLKRMADYLVEELHIPSRVHGRLIGVGRQIIREIEKNYSVYVEFPPRGTHEDAADIVIVMGPLAGVDGACDYLIERANELAISMPEPERPTAPKATISAPPPRPEDFAVVGAPWEKQAAH